jgi:hypothetical protein
VVEDVEDFEAELGVGPAATEVDPLRDDQIDLLEAGAFD